MTHLKIIGRPLGLATEAYFRFVGNIILKHGSVDAKHLEDLTMPETHLHTLVRRGLIRHEYNEDAGVGVFVLTDEGKEELQQMEEKR